MYFRGQMISNEDFQFISKFDNANADQRQAILTDSTMKMQVCADTDIFYTRLTHLSLSKQYKHNFEYWPFTATFLIYENAVQILSQCLINYLLIA